MKYAPSLGIFSLTTAFWIIAIFCFLILAFITYVKIRALNHNIISVIYYRIIPLYLMVSYLVLKYFVDYSYAAYYIDLDYRPIMIFADLFIDLSLVMILMLVIRKNFFTPSNHEIHTNGNIESINDSVKKIFDSNEFYSAISAALPKGSNDPDHGLDYIPFMLQNINERKARFKKSANNFLAAIISLSLLFVLLIAILSYMLLNESSIGVYREMENLRLTINTLEEKTLIFDHNINSNQAFQEVVGDKLVKLLNEKKGRFEKNKRGYFMERIYSIVSEINYVKNINDNKRDSLDIYLDSLSNYAENKDIIFIESVRSAIYSIDDFIRLRAEALMKINQSNDKIAQILPKIQAELDKPSNRQNELIKRLILSIVVVTFFMAILRYFRNLYHSHYSEMLKAEHQDIFIRKFYVALKNSENNSENRRIVLSAFLAENLETDTSDSKQSSKVKSTRVDDTMLKEILNSILKKL